jgi:hypothetical protein
LTLTVDGRERTVDRADQLGELADAVSATSPAPR